MTKTLVDFFTGRGSDATGMKRAIWYRLPVVVYCLLIFWQSSYPSPDGLPVFLFSDKLLHLLGYALLGFLVIRALAKESLNLKGGWLFLAAVLISTVYGVSDEIHQAFVPGRCSSVSDIVADALGGILGVFCFTILSKKK